MSPHRIHVLIQNGELHKDTLPCSSGSKSCRFPSVSRKVGTTTLVSQVRKLRSGEAACLVLIQLGKRASQESVSQQGPPKALPGNCPVRLRGVGKAP